MKSVGNRELKTRLRESLRPVRSGEILLITDRGLYPALPLARCERRRSAAPWLDGERGPR
jgi:antitoxin (DNA-binding transcriptional repressor) of toxin-antitoxin stability system